MFLVLTTYKKSIEEVERYLVAHRAFLEEGYQKDYFIVSGPRTTRTGGIILSQLKSHEQLSEILKNDPFAIQGIAEYEIVPFTPVKFHPLFEPFIV